MAHEDQIRALAVNIKTLEHQLLSRYGTTPSILFQIEDDIRELAEETDVDIDSEFDFETFGTGPDTE